MILIELADEDIATRDIELIYRTMRKVGIDVNLTIAYLCNYTIDTLARYVDVMAVLKGKNVQGYIAPYNQYYQEVLNSDSELIKSSPDIIWLSLSMRELSPLIYFSYLSLSEGEIRNEQNRIVGHIIEWVNVAKLNTAAMILVANFPLPVFMQAGIADAQLAYGEAEFYLELNLKLLKEFKQDSRVNIFDLNNVVSRFGKINAHSPKMYYLAKMEWSEQCYSYIADEILRYISVIKGDVKKCLVLDLDNTLWGGIVGEDGVLGIKVGGDDPVSEAFLDFQRVIHSLKDRGVILSICSKNNIEDVLEVFKKRDDMVLDINDFAAVQINWENKAQNIQAISEILNIGTDSMIFVDDNPLECELIKNALPEVETILLPNDPSEYANILRSANYFEKLFITEDDSYKNEHYQQNAQRKELKKKVGDITEFLEGLGTEIIIKTATQADVSRVHQLFVKTNQFNLTTKRYIFADIEEFIRNQKWDLKTVSVSDKFGNLGIVGLYMLEKVDCSAQIDSFILSCRAMGRGIETAMLNNLKKDISLDKKITGICAKFIPTKKNRSVVDFYQVQGFELLSEDSTGVFHYFLDAVDINYRDCPGITTN